MTLYSVHKGRVPGVYNDWETCKKQVNGYAGNKHRSFRNRADADYYVKNGKDRPVRKITDLFQFVSVTKQVKDARKEKQTAEKS